MSIFIHAKQAKNMDNVRFVDCRHQLTDPDFGRNAFVKEHLPNAVFAHLDKDLSGNITDKSGRHPLPSVNKFHNWLEQNGLSPEFPIVAYDNFNGGIAARLWWMLTQIGYDQVYIMLDGIEGWKEAGLQLETDITQPEKKEISLEVSSWDAGPYSIKSLHEIQNIVPSDYLIDSRSPERHRGEEEPYDTIAGTIPGSKNIYWQSHMDNDILKSDIQENISKIIDLSDLGNYIVYCGSGVTAAFNLAIFAELGLPKPAYYPGSYSEWSQNFPDNIEKHIE